MYRLLLNQASRACRPASRSMTGRFSYGSSASTQPVAITVAITGDCHDRSRTAVPITVEQQIDAAVESYEAGARIVHLHVRDDAGKASSDEATYKKVLDGIRSQAPDLLVEFSTTNFAPTIEGQVACLQHAPDLASVTPGSTNLGFNRPNVQVYVNTHEQITAVTKEMVKRRVKPTLGIFDVSMLYNAHKLMQAGLVEEQPRFIFVLGGHMALPARKPLLEFLLSECDALFGQSQYTWTTVGVGWNQEEVVDWTVGLGGHPRTGFEDTLMLRKGVHATSNAELVRQVVATCERHGRRLATPAEARTLLSLPR